MLVEVEPLAGPGFLAGPLAGPLAGLLAGPLAGLLAGPAQVLWDE